MLRVGALSVVLFAGVASADDARMRIEVPHKFTRADAHARAQLLFDYWKRAYGVEARWQGDVAHIVGRVMGIAIDAVLVVTDDRIGGEGDDPGPLFRTLARNYITRKLQKYMHPRYEEPS